MNHGLFRGKKGRNNVIYTLDVFDVISTIKSFFDANRGNESTENIILAIGAELLNVSTDAMYEAIDK